MLPWSQRGQRTTCRSQWAQLNRRPKFLIAAVDENGLDPRQDPHDTVHLGRAEHGSGGVNRDGNTTPSAIENSPWTAVDRARHAAWLPSWATTLGAADPHRPFPAQIDQEDRFD